MDNTIVRAIESSLQSFLHSLSPDFKHFIVNIVWNKLERGSGGGTPFPTITYNANLYIMDLKDTPLVECERHIQSTYLKVEATKMENEILSKLLQELLIIGYSIGSSYYQKSTELHGIK